MTDLKHKSEASNENILLAFKLSGRKKGQKTSGQLTLLSLI